MALSLALVLGQLDQLCAKQDADQLIAEKYNRCPFGDRNGSMSLYCPEKGATTGSVELPPAGALTGLAKRAMKGTATLALKTPDQLDKVAELFDTVGATK